MAGRDGQRIQGLEKQRVWKVKKIKDMLPNKLFLFQYLHRLSLALVVERPPVLVLDLPHRLDGRPQPPLHVHQKLKEVLGKLRHQT